MFCRIIEYPAKCTSFNFICFTRIADSLENEPVLISGKIMGRKQSPLRINFLCKTGQPMSTSWRRGTKEHLFYRTSPSGCFWILRLFSFRIEEGRGAFEEEENEFLQRDIKENSNNLVQNQEQVTASSIASVMKTSTSSYCSGKSQISNKSSSSGSREWIHNEIIELIAIWEDLSNIRHPDYSVKQK